MKKYPKIVIHTYPKRKWYVDNFLVPALQSQGLEDITIYNDKYCIGNLMAFVLSLKDCGSAYHLQDDVIICQDFADQIRNHTKYITCGFCIDSFEKHPESVGITNINNIWWSFPCIYIPGNIAEEFYNWFMDQKEKSADFQKMINSGKMDDYIFKTWLIEKYPDMLIEQLKPNLVDHIDYLLGGSIANSHRKEETRSKSFPDKELVKKLEGDIYIFRVQNNMLED